MADIVSIFDLLQRNSDKLTQILANNKELFSKFYEWFTSDTDVTIEIIDPDTGQPVQYTIPSRNQFQNSLLALVNSVQTNLENFEAQFEGDLSEAGYYKFPNGLIVQWGRVDWQNTGDTASKITVDITFPIAFPNACLALYATNYYQVVGESGDESTEHVVATYITDSTSGKLIIERLYGSNSGSEYGHTFWLAIGY